MFRVCHWPGRLEATAWACLGGQGEGCRLAGQGGASLLPLYNSPLTFGRCELREVEGWRDGGTEGRRDTCEPLR
jgi:hypothetical protein